MGPFEEGCSTSLVERLRFLPVRGGSPDGEVDEFIVRQINRSKGSLQKKLREIYSDGLLSFGLRRSFRTLGSA